LNLFEMINVCHHCGYLWYRKRKHNSLSIMIISDNLFYQAYHFQSMFMDWRVLYYTGHEKLFQDLISCLPNVFTIQLCQCMGNKMKYKLFLLLEYISHTLMGLLLILYLGPASCPPKTKRKLHTTLLSLHFKNEKVHTKENKGHVGPILKPKSIHAITLVNGSMIIPYMFINASHEFVKAYKFTIHKIVNFKTWDYFFIFQEKPFFFQKIYPAVINLQLHLPNQQCITYWANQNLENILSWDHVSKTMLTEYFSICFKSEVARKYIYMEFLEYYLWDKQGKYWKERKKRYVIRHINTINPIDGERYYLRLLLNHVKGPTSFQDLLIVNDIPYSKSDLSITECLNEAVTFQMPYELQRLFAIILVYCAPTNVRVLWETYFEDIACDCDIWSCCRNNARGRTTYSHFKIPIDANKSSECTISKQSGAAELLPPMRKRWAIDNIDRLLKDVTGNDKDIGGKVIVFGEDFRQVLPVVPRATIYQTISASLVKSYLWPKMKKITLSRNIRLRNDPNFSKLLLKVGNGDEPTDIEGNIKISKEMIIEISTQLMTSRAILASKNEHVDRLNDKLISIFPGEARTFNSFDKAIDDINNYYEEDFLYSLTLNGLPPYKLVLKRNYPIILLRNLDPSNGLCNGTRMVCRDFKNNIIDAEIIFRQHTGKHVFIPRLPLLPAENEGYPFQFRRKQFPIRLCFTMTINKVQG
ncbi:hypothetical protein Pfo_024583, partial [Paulownia fortunei]